MNPKQAKRLRKSATKAAMEDGTNPKKKYKSFKKIYKQLKQRGFQAELKPKQ